MGLGARLKRIFRILVRSSQALRQILEANRENNPAKVVTAKESWAKAILEIVGLRHIEITGSIPDHGRPCLMVSNHVSYLEIPLLMAVIPHISFVAKKEIKSWPIFGKAAAATGSLFLDRSSKDSKIKTAAQLAHFILDEKRSPAVFPEGTTSLAGKEWKKGAFLMAHESHFPVLPVRVCYKPLRPAAYIDDDFFLTHLFKLLKQGEISASIEFGEAILIQDPLKDCHAVQEWVQRSFVKKCREWNQKID